MNIAFVSSFGYVSCNDGLEFVPKPRALLSEFRYQFRIRIPTVQRLPSPPENGRHKSAGAAWRHEAIDHFAQAGGRSRVNSPKDSR